MGLTEKSPEPDQKLVLRVTRVVRKSPPNGTQSWCLKRLQLYGKVHGTGPKIGT